MTAIWNTAHLRAVTLTLVLLVIIADCSSEIQAGYPKRDPMFAIRRADGERGSGRSTRFYQGTRYGKRGYWQPFLSAETDATSSQERPNASKIARDCAYLSLMGYRCPDRLNDLAYKSHQQNVAEAGGSVGAGSGSGGESHILNGRLWNAAESLEKR